MIKRCTLKIISVVMCVIIAAVSVPVCASSLSVPDLMTLAYEKETALAPGITQTESVLYKQNGDRVACYTAVADLNVSTVKIEANYKDNQSSVYGLQTLSDQVAAAERNHAEPYNVAASVNASFFNMPSGTSCGVFVMNGVMMTDSLFTYSYPFFAIMKDGTPRIGRGSEVNELKDNMLHAIGGTPLILLNGRINSSDGEHIADYDETLHPRTCVGITPDNKVIFLVADGRQATSSGLTPYEAALIFQSMGCTSALMLDGGGSATFGSKVPGEDFTIKNSPSDGGERSIGGSFLIVSEAEPTGTLDHINLNCDFNHLSAGSSVTITPVALDSSEAPVPMPESGISWSVSDPSKGSITQDGVFTANENAEGDLTVYISLNGNILGSIDLSVVVPDKITFAKKKLSAPYSSRIEIPFKATYGEYPVAINENDIIAVHEYEFNGSVHDSLLENYGYFDGFYFNTPDESMAVKTEMLYMIPYFAEDESQISTMTIEFYKEGEDFFDFDNATYQTDEVSFYRELSNTTTKDNYNYFITDNDKPVIASYKYGIAMDELEPPEALVPLWDAFSALLGDTIWDAFLTLASKISSDTTVTIKMTVDPNYEFCGFNDLTISNNLFTFDKNEITVDEGTNTATFVFRWNEAFIKDMIESDEGLTADAVSSTIIVKGFNLRLKDPSLAQNSAGLKMNNSYLISYDLYAWSTSAYQIADETEELKPYAYESGNKKGIRFNTDYASGEESYMIFGSSGTQNGWSGDSYYVNGSALTGVQLLPDKDGTDNEFYYEFDSSGALQGKYTGVIKSDDSIRYSQDGSAVFAGLVKDDNNDYYYVDETLEAVKNTTVYIEKTNSLADAGTYDVLADGRVIVSTCDGGLISYGEYLNLTEFPDVLPQGTLTTGSVIGFYSGGVLECLSIVKYGDIDADGKTDACDSVLVSCIINAMLSENDLTPAQFRAADCNSDGQISDDDYFILISAGLMTQEISLS